MSQNNDTSLSPQESLKVIHAMIQSTRTTMGDNSSYFLLWGWAVMAACLLQFVLLQMKSEKHSLAWLIIIPVTLVVHFILLARKTKKQKVKTFVGDASGYLWMGLGFCFCAFPLIFAKIGWQYSMPFYILIYGVGTFVTGKLIDFKPLVYGGVCCFLLAVMAPYTEYKYQLLMASFAILVSYVIPGHLLRKFYKKN